ncbi:PREDICTED: histone-lysine N-methyltransferase SUVR5-like isoform X1 [Nelumbo nucifera]|uniref:Histone-lysine N-methyltransferase SUVR5-like isoform X1 n=1 Tax=Nelumbo nucifera TaxID=4432 RepID=A0A1U8A1M0_NELNU|nr:PREDICTED: histone-lysine N-methyltransferase SUVR5-like isoform X1 [Nelumbo nucifera]
MDHGHGWTKPKGDVRPSSSPAILLKSSQLGCACSHSTCYPEKCDHVYLFGNDYENAKDIYGKPIRGDFHMMNKAGLFWRRVIQFMSAIPCAAVTELAGIGYCRTGCRSNWKSSKQRIGVGQSELVSQSFSGTFVCEYIGEVLADQEANRRGNRFDNEGCSYLYDIDPHINDISGLTEGAVPYVIDATILGNVSRFINHCCSPNLVNYLVLVDSMDCRLAHIGLYARQDISAGEELGFDYHYKLLPGQGHSCHCGAPNCRGRLC